MMVDAPMRRLLATHPGKKTVVVLNLDTHTVHEVMTGVVNGVDVDPTHNSLFVAGGGERVVILNRWTLAHEREIALTGPADDIVYDPKNGMLYVGHDDGTEVWAIDPQKARVVGAIKIADAPEVMNYDRASSRIYQNIKPANIVQIINPATNQAEGAWPTKPITSPHGVAIDATTRRLFSAGNGQVAVIDMKSGKVIQVVAIAPGYVDQIAFDPVRRRLYCACGNGFIGVVGETAAGAVLLANVPSHKGAHTLAVDPRTHSVWISYTDAYTRYLQEFRAR